METRKIVWIALLGLAFLGFQLTASPALAGPPQPPTLDVNVVNTPSVSITGIPSVNIANVGTYQYVGISNDNTTGAAGGIGGMNDLCKDEFGSTAKMCNTKEYFSSNISNSNPPYPPSENAWIQPVFVAATYIDTHVLYVDYSGDILHSATSHETFNCTHWVSDSGTRLGMVLWNAASGGNFLDPTLCNFEFKVVCCDVQ